MMSLAEHIIEATPECIKREHFPAVKSVPLDNSGLTNTMSWLASYLGDVEHLPSIIHLRLAGVRRSANTTESQFISVHPC